MQGQNLDNRVCIAIKAWHAPSVTEENATPYQRVGGQDAVRVLVDRFYDYMDTLESAQEIRAMHPETLDGSREKLFEFLCGWLGGPPIYIQKRGHPRLRARHLPFAIGDRARDAWMECMILALTDSDLDPDIRAQLGSVFQQMATHLRNKDD